MTEGTPHHTMLYYYGAEYEPPFNIRNNVMNITGHCYFQFHTTLGLERKYIIMLCVLLVLAIVCIPFVFCLFGSKFIYAFCSDHRTVK